MISIKIHKSFVKNLSTVYLKGKYFSVYAINLYFFAILFEFWKK